MLPGLSVLDWASQRARHIPVGQGQTVGTLPPAVEAPEPVADRRLAMASTAQRLDQISHTAAVVGVGSELLPPAEVAV